MEKFRLSQKITINLFGNSDEDEEPEMQHHEENQEEEDANDDDDSDNDDAENDDNFPSQYNQGYYVLYDEERDREFLINDTIKYFIDKFSTPKSKAEVLEEIEVELKSDRAAIEEVCSRFFHFLCKRGVLVPEDHEERVKVDTPLYKEGDGINELTISKVISNRRHVEIYLGVNGVSGHEYAIKLLNRNKTVDELSFQDELKMLKREYNFLQNVQHIPQMCRVYSFKKMQEDHPYLMLEYIKGKALHRFLKETPALTKTTCFSIIENILHAFSSLHEGKLIHGDIHSANVMITEDNSVKIIDMGLTLNVEEIEKNEVVKFGGVIFYMPPERINITTVNKYTVKPNLYSDVYQVGLLMYLVLYNKTPFKGFIWEELAGNIKNSEAAFPDTSFLNYKIPNRLINIVKKCIAKNPAERYRNAAEILDSFEKHVLTEQNTLVN